MLFGRKKLEITEEERIDNLRHESLATLSNLKDNDMIPLMHLVANFFSELFKLKTKVTFEELKEEIEKRNLNYHVKGQTMQFLDQVTELHYSRSSVDTRSFNRLVHSFRIVIDSIVGQMIQQKHSAIGGHFMAAFLNPKHIFLHLNRFIRGNRVISQTHMHEVFDLLSQTRKMLALGDTAKAKELYSQVLRLYSSSLSESEKREAYFHIAKLYEKFQRSISKNQGGQGQVPPGPNSFGFL